MFLECLKSHNEGANFRTAKYRLLPAPRLIRQDSRDRLRRRETGPVSRRAQLAGRGVRISRQHSERQEVARNVPYNLPIQVNSSLDLTVMFQSIQQPLDLKSLPLAHFVLGVPNAKSPACAFKDIGNVLTHGRILQ